MKAIIDVLEEQIKQAQKDKQYKVMTELLFCKVNLQQLALLTEKHFRHAYITNYIYNGKSIANDTNFLDKE